MITEKFPAPDEHLDKIGRELLQASSINEAEVHAAASSPWLFSRVRARITAESVRRETSDRWSIFVTVMRHAIPATAGAAVLALGLFVFTNSTSPQTSPQFSDQALFETSDAGVQHIVFAERRPLSPDEVLDTIINEDREVVR